MNENFNYLFQYLEKEGIQVDKEEFLFQIQSHPDYPSILAIADALTFFNIQNGVVRVAVSEIELLPKRFIALLIQENDKAKLDTKLYLIEQKGRHFFYRKDKKIIEIPKSELDSRWKGVVLLAEKAETDNEIYPNNNILSWVLVSSCLLFFVFLLFIIEESIKNKLFFIFPIIGILFSVAALKDLFGAKSELINNFCNITSTTSCSDIIGSNKWKIFSFIDLGSLSIVFFATQLIAFFIFLISNNTTEYFYIQKILLLGSVPVALLSIYYQKNVAKKWCPICLAIVSTLFLEFGVLLVFQENSLNISLKSLILFCFVFFTIALVWKQLKITLTKQKKLKEFELKASRFIRNYEIFKNTLLANKSFDLPKSLIILGNKKSDTEITIITSPFCAHCKSVHKIFDNILRINRDRLKIKVLINVDIDSLDEEKKIFFRSLLSIYLEKGDASFLEALNYWFETNNLKDWIKIYELPFDSDQMDSIYRKQNQWCKNNNFNFTPAVFVNSFQYPKTFSREYLEFYVNDLIEDISFELV